MFLKVLSSFCVWKGAIVVAKAEFCLGEVSRGCWKDFLFLFAKAYRLFGEGSCFLRKGICAFFFVFKISALRFSSQGFHNILVSMTERAV